MKQMGLASSGFELKTKRTRKREFLEEMELVVPWAELQALIAAHAPAGKTGRPPFAVRTLLRIHFLQQWFNLSDPAMEEALYDMELFRQFTGLDNGIERLPDESTILRFRHLLEEHELSLRIMGAVNATLAQLRVIGGGQQMPAMKDFVNRAGLEKHVVFLGPHDKATVAAEMRTADLFLHPSEYETFSVVCAEALCSGLPVIASNVGGIPEFVDETNGLLVSNTAQAWRAALVTAFNNLQKWDRVAVAESARDKLTPKAIGDQLMRIYLSACAQPDQQ